MVADSSQSLLAAIGKVVAPIFAPLGFDDWRIATSLIAGFTAKEAVVSTMGVLLGTSMSNLSAVLPQYFTLPTACAFLTFTLLYTPCVAAIATIKRELGSRWQTLLVILMQCSVAWIAAYIVHTVAMMLG